MKRLVVSVGAALLLSASSPSAWAITIQIASYGTLSSGQDLSGVFGTPGENLTGHAYSYVATFDLTNAGYFTNGVRSDIFGGPSYAYLPTTPPSLGGGVLTINGQSQTLVGQWNTTLVAYIGDGFSFDQQFVQDYLNETDHYRNNAVVLHEEPSFGLFSLADYTPPAGNLCAVASCLGGLFSFEETLNGQTISSAYGSLAPRSTTITAVPEPTAWTLLIMGLVILRMSQRRRRDRAATS
jgi:hypothetical protein